MRVTYQIYNAVKIRTISAHSLFLPLQIQLTSFKEPVDAGKKPAKHTNGTTESNGEAESDQNGSSEEKPAKKMKTRLPVDLELEYVLGDMPKKVNSLRWPE